MNKNIFILGPVASGKNTLMNKLSQYYNMPVFDSGKLFRVVTYFFINSPNFGKLKEDETYFLQVINKRSQKIFEKLKQLELCGDNFIYHGEILNDEKLYSKEVNQFILKIGKEPNIRKKIIALMNQFLKNDNFILTGHDLNEIDTTQFITIFLDIDDQVAAARLLQREPANFKSKEDALKHLQLRNKKDGIEATKKILKSTFNLFRIDTSKKSEKEVFDEATNVINKLLKIEKRFHDNQTSAISRNQFEWLTNPIFDIIKEYLDESLKEPLQSLPYISKTDLEYQILIKLAYYKPDQIFSGDKDFIKNLSKGINLRDISFLDDLLNKIETGHLTINKDIIDAEIINQTERLIGFYTQQGILSEMEIINNINFGCQYSLFDVQYRKLDSETSCFIAKNCHYLHSPRNDEYVSYAGFLPGIDFPIAWVSYSLQDRDYKKQLLYEMGIEPQYTLEMTRAWCSNYAPKNIMSSLFQFSFNEIKKEWRFGKPFVGVSTTINPNLSFKASSFLGSNFITCALRPARYTYQKKIDGKYEYSTRRNLSNLDFVENNLPILPLNEMFMCMDTNKREKLRTLSIFNIDKKEYDKVVEAQQSEQNIDSFNK